VLEVLSVMVMTEERKELGKNKYGKPISQYMRNKRGSNVDKLTGYTGLGLRMAGEWKKWKTAVYRRPGLDKLIDETREGATDEWR